MRGWFWCGVEKSDQLRKVFEMILKSNNGSLHEKPLQASFLDSFLAFF
jgi:hypothetical protein